MQYGLRSRQVIRISRQHCRTSRLAISRREAATAINIKEGSADFAGDTQHETSLAVLELLKEIGGFLRREIVGVQQWESRLRTASEQIQYPSTSRIGVWGTKYAGRHQVVTSLVRDALTDDPAIIERLMSRRVSNSSTALEIGIDARNDVPVVSSWLHSTQRSILEITSDDKETVLSHLLTCEVVVIVLDPQLPRDSTFESLLPLVRNDDLPNHLVINGSFPNHQLFRELQERFQDDFGISKPLIFVQADKAVSALDLFAGPHTPSTSALQLFQTDFNDSGVGQLQRIIGLRRPPMSRSRMALRVASLALDAAEDIVHADVDENGDILRRAEKLKDSLSSKPITGVDSRSRLASAAEESVAYSTQTLQGLFASRWTWLNLVFRARVDDLGNEVSSLIREDFGRGLEQAVAFEMGKYEQVGVHNRVRAERLLRDVCAAGRNRSTVAENELLGLLRRQKSSSFTAPHLPINLRRQQLLDAAVSPLQYSARVASAAMCTIGLSGVAGSWVASSMCLLEPINAVSCSILLVLVSVRVGQRLWHRAQARFWREWSRITGMLQVDTRDIVSVAGEQIASTPLATYAALKSLIDTRAKRLEKVQSQLKKLRQSTKAHKDQL